MRATARSLARASPQLSRAPPRAIKYIRANQDLIALSTANGHNRRSTPHVRFDDIISLLPPRASPSSLPPLFSGSRHRNAFFFLALQNLHCNRIAFARCNIPSANLNVRRTLPSKTPLAVDSLSTRNWYESNCINRYIEKPKIARLIIGRFPIIEIYAFASYRNLIERKFVRCDCAWLVRFAKVTIYTGESTTELLLCLFWCDALFLRRGSRVGRHNSRIVWKRPVLLRRSIHRHASESTSKFGVRREMTMAPFIQRPTILRHLIRATSVTCRQHDVRAARHDSPGCIQETSRRFVPRTRTSSNAPGISIRARHDPDSWNPGYTYVYHSRKTLR